MTQAEFESLVEKIREDGDGQHGPSMIDVQKLIDEVIRLRAALDWHRSGGASPRG